MNQHYRISTLIHSSAERIWHVFCQVEHWQAWTASITRIERMDGVDFVPGARFRILQPRLRPAVWTITELQPGRRFAWESSQPGVRIVAEHVIEPVPEGCRVTLTITFSGPLGVVFGWLGRKLIRRYIAMECAGLKQHAEQG